MIDHFARRAAALFGIAMPVALFAVLLAPVPFMRGLGAAAFGCAAFGLVVNLLALRGARAATATRPAHFTGEEAIAPQLAAATPVPPVAVRAVASDRPSDLRRRAQAVGRPVRLPARMISHA